MDFADRILQLAPSLTVAIDSRAKELATSGVDIVSLGAGEPDFPTPDPIVRAAIQAILDGETRYGPPNGLLSLRRAVCEKLQRENSLSYTPEQIVVSSGAKQAISNAIAALINPGDQALIPAPYWVTYPELVKFYGGTPVFLPTQPQQQFVLRADAVQKAITPQTKLLILNSPNNPSGASIPFDELQKIAELCIKQNIWVISDEIYEHLLYDGRSHHSIAQVSPQMQEQTVVVNGVSKAYAMTGWRIGYSAAPTELSKKIGAMQGQTSHHPATPSQLAAVAALQSGLQTIEPMREQFALRRRYLARELQQIPNLTVEPPHGAFYLLIGVQHYLGRTIAGERISNSLELSQWLLEQEHLATVPGSAFGLEGYLRLSYTTSPERLQEAVVRLRRAFAALQEAV